MLDRFTLNTTRISVSTYCANLSYFSCVGYEANGFGQKKCDVLNKGFSYSTASSWALHLIVVRRFEYADDPKSYISGSVATGRVSHAGKVEG